MECVARGSAGRLVSFSANHRILPSFNCYFWFCTCSRFLRTTRKEKNQLFLHHRHITSFSTVLRIAFICVCVCLWCMNGCLYSEYTLATATLSEQVALVWKDACNKAKGSCIRRRKRNSRLLARAVMVFDAFLRVVRTIIFVLVRLYFLYRKKVWHLFLCSVEVGIVCMRDNNNNNNNNNNDHGRKRERRK